jgi:hypothetical protein
MNHTAITPCVTNSPGNHTFISWKRLISHHIHTEDQLANYLSPRSTAFEKLTVAQLVKNFPGFYVSRMFNIVFTRGRYWTTSWANWIQSTFSNPISWRPISLLQSYLRLDLASGLLPSGFPTKILYYFSFLPCVLHVPSHRPNIWQEKRSMNDTRYQQNNKTTSIVFILTNKNRTIAHSAGKREISFLFSRVI